MQYSPVIAPPHDMISDLPENQAARSLFGDDKVAPRSAYKRIAVIYESHEEWQQNAYPNFDRLFQWHSRYRPCGSFEIYDD